MRELARLFERDLTRLIQEIEAFEGRDAELWQTGGAVSNSCGNLALHVEGNLREYVGRILGGIAYTRQRDREFADAGLNAAALLDRLRDLRATIPPVIANLDEAAQAAIYPQNVLGIPMTTAQFLMHLYGHLGYHLGQMDSLRRLRLGNQAIAFEQLKAAD